jgi:hypothetical protein
MALGVITDSGQEIRVDGPVTTESLERVRERLIKAGIAGWIVDVPDTITTGPRPMREVGPIGLPVRSFQEASALNYLRRASPRRGAGNQIRRSA